MTTATTGRKARTGFTGMFAWLVQRASAVYLLLCVVSLLVFFLMRSRFRKNGLGALCCRCGPVGFSMIDLAL